MFKNILNLLNKIIQVFSLTSKRELFFISSFSIVLIFIETLGIGLIGPVIASVMNENLLLENKIFLTIFPFTSDYNKSELLFFTLSLFLTAFLLKVFLTIIINFNNIKIYFKLGEKYSNELLTKYFRMEWSFYTKKNSAEIIRNIISQAYTIPLDVIAPSFLIVTEILMVIFISIFLFIVDPYAFIGIFIILILTAIFYNFFTKNKIIEIGKKREKNQLVRFSNLIEITNLMKEIKIYNKSNFFLNKFKKNNKEISETEISGSMFAIFPRLIFELIFILSLSTLLIVFFNFETSMEKIFVKVGIFFAAGIRLMPSFSRLTLSLSKVIEKIPLIENFINEIKYIKIKNIEETNLKNINVNKIEVENLSFKYNNNQKFLFEGLSFKINKGEIFGIFGKSGVGKSTLLECICGLLQPNLGTISVNNSNIENLKEWKNSIGYIPQETQLLNSTIKKNIAFGVREEDIDENKLVLSIKLAGLEEFVRELPDGFETMVGERGSWISGGQRQRISIARAIYSEKNFLVLDEATNSLDHKTSLEIMDNIKKLKENGITTLIVSHDKEIINYTDNKLELKS